MKKRQTFQRIGVISNAHVGRDFEFLAQEFFKSIGTVLNRNVAVPVGIESVTKSHAFDLGNLKQKVLVECKSHKWTVGGNVPSAKLTVWNEAMYYFLAAPKGFRKIMFVLKDYSEKRKLTLAEYYLNKFSHLIPSDVEFWEYDEENQVAKRLAFRQK